MKKIAPAESPKAPLHKNEEKDSLSRLLLDSFVSDSSGGIAGVERSLWAHRWQLGIDCGTVAYNLLPNEKGTSRSEGDRIAAYYETVVAKKLQLVGRKQMSSPTHRRGRSNNSSFVARIPEELGPLGNVLNRVEMAQSIRDVDLFDALSSTVDEAVLTLTMSHSVSARTNAAVSLGAFCYVVSRTMLRAALLQMTREEIAGLAFGADACHQPEGPGINELLVKLLPAARAQAVLWFTTVDVDGLGLVPWNSVTSALVEYCSAQHLKRCLDDALGDDFKESAPLSGADAIGPVAALPSRRIGTYDRFHTEAFPVAKAVKPYSNAVVVVQNSPYLILEGRADTHALVTRDAMTAVRHTFARHRVEGTKICGSTVVFATVIDAGSTPALCVAEVDMNVHLYDFSSKQRRVLPLLVRIRTDSAIVACCYILRSSSLVIGDRTGTLKALDANAAVLQAHELFSRKPGDEDTPDDEREFLFDDLAFFCETVHRDAITAIALCAPSLMLSASLDGNVSVVHATTWTRIRTFSAHAGAGIRSLAGDEALTTFATHGYDGITRLWFSAHGVNHSVLVEPLVPHQHRVDWMFVDASVQQLLTVDVSGLVKVWDMQQHTIISTFFAITEMPAYLFGLEHALGASTAAAAAESDGGGVIRDLPYDVAPVQSSSYDRHKHRLFVRGFQNDVVSTLIEGRKSLSAHPMSVKALFAANGCAVSLCAKTFRAWSLPLLELRCEVPSSLRLTQGDTPPPLAHQVADQIGLGDHRTTRSDVLHEAIDPEGITLGGYQVTSHRPGEVGGADGLVGDTAYMEACTTCVDADHAHVFVVLGNGEIRCYQSGTGKCVKIFVAQRVLNTTQRWANHSSGCGRSLDAVSCCYMDQDHMLAVCYTDGAIRYFSNVGALRHAFGVQVIFEDDSSGKDNSPTRASGQRLSVSRGGDAFSPRNAIDALDESLTSLSQSTTATLRSAVVGIAVSACSPSLRLAANAFTDGRVEVVELAMTQPIVKIIHTLTVQHEVVSMTFLAQFACLIIGDTDATLRCYAVRGAPLLSVANELVSNAQTLDRKRRVSRAFNVSPMAGARTPNVPSLPSSVARRRSIAAAVATLTTPRSPAQPSAQSKGTLLCCLASVTLAARPTCLSFEGGEASIIIAGLADGRIQILYAHALVVCVTLSAPGAVPRHSSIFTPVSPPLDGDSHIVNVRESALRLVGTTHPATDETEETSPFITSVGPGSLKMDSWGPPATQVSFTNAITATMTVQLLLTTRDMFPEGVSVDNASKLIASWLLQNRSYSSPLSSATERVHCELAPLVSSLWVHEDVIHHRPDISCLVCFPAKLASAISVATTCNSLRRLTVDESTIDISGALNAYALGPPITAIARLHENQLLVGNQSGEIALVSLTGGGSIASMNAGASVAGALLERLNEWQRSYAYAHHKALVAMNAAGGVTAAIGSTTSSLPKRNGASTGAPTAASRAPADLFQIGHTLESWADVPLPNERVNSFLQQQCIQLLKQLGQEVMLDTVTAAATSDGPSSGLAEANMTFLWDKLERHVGQAAASVDEVSNENTPQESFLEAFNSSIVRLSSPPSTKSPMSKIAGMKVTPLTPTLLMTSTASPSFVDNNGQSLTIKPPPRNASRSPRAASFLSVDNPAPPLTGFLSAGPAPLGRLSPGAPDSPQESLNGSISLFENSRPRKARTIPRVVLAQPSPFARPQSAGVADPAQCSPVQVPSTTFAASPRHAKWRSSRLPADMRLRYMLLEGDRGSAVPPQANKTREMALTTNNSAATLSERMKQLSAINQQGTARGPMEIGFGLVLPSK